jgi:hypothetical protein
MNLLKILTILNLRERLEILAKNLKNKGKTLA